MIATRNTTRFLLILLVGYFPFNISANVVPAAGIATAHPAATEAGHEILAAGGNAFDAAVAISASLAVVEPMSSGLGGGGFWLLHREKDNFDIMIDGREKAPKAAQRNMYLDEAGEVIPGLSITGPLSAGIPGLPAAIVHLSKKYGRLTLNTSLQPAIRQARNGFKVNQHYRRMAEFRLEALRKSPAAAAIFLKNNQIPEIGTIIKQPDLAITLELLAKKGADGFYKGDVAKKLVKGVQAAKGIWSMADLASYQLVERKPIRSEYQGIRITSAAPPSSGGIALTTLLNILSGYDLKSLNNTQRKHLIVESMRRAYRDRAIYLGDPDFVKIPTSTLTSQHYAIGLSASIRPDKAMPSALLPGIITPPRGQDTTHFSVIDKDGNRVAATLTINYPFGSCFVAPGTGVLLNDEMDDFSSKPGTPNAYGLVGAEANAIEPDKRPLSSMSPTFLENDRGIVVLGTPGGSRIITMVLLAILNYADGGSANSMVTLPRYHHQFLPDTLYYEKAALTEKEVQGLQQRGHQLEALKSSYGNMQVVFWDKRNKRITAASDPRATGAAVVR
ncbi:MAG: gamma-glutamyltransferase [Gammaproteobacteria bacterium]|nr:gamma-glutamyltransferase [Gammaproteobacteria bacterium]